MSQLAHVCIDHATIYCKNAAEMDRLFSMLGFYSRNRIHYMLPNSYFELYQPHSENETYAFFRSDAGLHSFIFWSDDIDDCYRRVVNAGYVTAMLISAVQPTMAIPGELPASAAFTCKLPCFPLAKLPLSSR